MYYFDSGWSKVSANVFGFASEAAFGIRLT
jgi:hypothetical protein